VHSQGVCSTTFTRHDDGSLTIIMATVTDGAVLTFHLQAEDAVSNVEAAARALGLLVSRPL